jgi:hypothetical protein
MKMEKWIHVNTELPKRHELVLVVFENTCRDDLMAIAYFDTGVWWLDINHALDRTYDHVTHWMPLPELPSE